MPPHHPPSGVDRSGQAVFPFREQECEIDESIRCYTILQVKVSTNTIQCFERTLGSLNLCSRGQNRAHFEVPDPSVSFTPQQLNCL